MKWRLGLDMGTNSIGWAAVELVSDEERKLLDLGVRIFSDGREPGKGGRIGDPKAIARRTARGARRLRERRRRRIRSMVAYLTQQGLLSKELLGQNSEWKDLNPYEIRVKALSSPLNGLELARVLVQLSRRRGFKSNRKDQGEQDGKTESEYKAMISAFEKHLQGQTLGQFLYQRWQENSQLQKSKKPQETKDVRFKKGTTEYYPSRKLYFEEFQKIRTQQAPHFPHLDWEKLEKIIFFQRPLRPVERGNCRYLKDEKRAFKNQPSSHQVRIAQELMNLKYYDSLGQYLPLSNSQFDYLYKELNQRKSLTFDKMRKDSILNLPKDCKFNLESDRRHELKGNPIHEVMGKRLGQETWNKFSLETQDRIMEILIASPEETLGDDLAKLGLNPEQIKAVEDFSPDNGTTQISAKFQRQLLEVILQEHCDYTNAVAKLGFHHSDMTKPEERETLPYYGEILQDYVMGGGKPTPPGEPENPELTYGKINNPTVHIALRQLQKLVNRLITRFGKPSQIIIELSRDLKLPSKAIDEILKVQTENQKIREEGKKQYAEAGFLRSPSDLDLKKYRLWKELTKGGNSHKCLYCGNTISAHELFASEVEIEHILPFSRTLDNSFGNLTLAHKSCNNAKGNQTPYEAFSHSPGKFIWQDILARAKQVGKEKKFAKDAMEFYEKDAGFLERQLTDNAYISKVCKIYLSCVTHHSQIWVTPGKLTSIIRAEWGFNTLLNQGHSTYHKNRTDHRHHAVDGLTIALTDRGVLQKISRMHSEDATRKELKVLVPPCPIDRNEVENRLKTLLVSHKPDHGYQGKIYAETAMGKVKTFVKLQLKNPEDLAQLTEQDLRTIKPIGIRTQVLAMAEELKNQKKKNWLSALKDQLQGKFTHLIVRRDRYAARAGITDWKKWDEVERRWCDRGLLKKLKIFLETERPSQPPADINEKDFKTLLGKFAEAHNIKTIRYFPKDEPAPGTEIPSAPYKRYNTEDYFCVDIWSIPQKGKPPKYEGVFVSRLEAYRNKTIREKPDPAKKPHPAAKFVMRLYKGDCIFAVYDGYPVHIKISRLNPSNKTLGADSLWNSTTLDEWIAETNPNQVQRGWPPRKQNVYGVNAIFSSPDCKKIIISEDGVLLSR